MGQSGRLTPYLLKRGHEMCPRRLAHEFRLEGATKDFFGRWRVRYPLLAALEEAHVEPRCPGVAELDLSVRGSELRAEEAAVLLRAATGYCEFFRDRPGATTDYSTTDAGRIGLGGAIDLVLTTPDGDVELRQLELWRRSVSASPFDSWEIGLAVYRLSEWLDTRPLHVVHLDALSGAADEYDFRPDDRSRLRQLLNERTTVLIQRMRLEDQPSPGRECLDCGHARNCPAVGRVA